MVRAGVVQHPSQWAFGGYNEIQNPKQRYSIVNRGELAKLLGIRDDAQMISAKGVGRKITGENSQYELREPQIPYSPLFTFEKCGLSNENSYFWDVFHKNSMR